MRTNVYKIVAIDLIFLAFVLASGVFQNPFISNVLYYLAFIIPIISGFVFIKKEDDKLTDKECKETPLTLSISKEKAILCVPFVFPCIALIAAVSFLTSFIMSLLGYGNTADIQGGFSKAFLLHALFPAATEELLFRYIPLRLLSNNKKSAVLISALLFSFAHTNLFSIPYAFAAGIIFAAADIFAGSILPSFVIHLLNNTAALLFMFKINTPLVIIIISALVLISVLTIVLKRKRYSEVKKNFHREFRYFAHSGTAVFTDISFYCAAKTHIK